MNQEKVLKKVPKLVSIEANDFEVNSPDIGAEIVTFDSKGNCYSTHEYDGRQSGQEVSWILVSELRLIECDKEIKSTN